MINRRSLITGLISFVAAPAIVRASSLMQVKAIIETPQEIYNKFISNITDYVQSDLYTYADPIRLFYIDQNKEIVMMSVKDSQAYLSSLDD